MAKKIDESVMDIRTLKLNTAHGKVTEKEYKDYLKTLPDLSDNVEELPAFEETKEDKEDSGLTFSAA